MSAGKQTADLTEAIRNRLLALRDPRDDRPVVHSVAIPSHDFHGSMLDSAPDLIVGYYPGYRGSWETALGATPQPLVEDNTDPWRGDHCIDPLFVPGVLLTNRKVAAGTPRLDDITVTALREFGVEPAPEMIGHSVFEEK